MYLTTARAGRFLTYPILARIATVDPQQMKPHVEPVWFFWDGEEIWVAGYQRVRDFQEIETNNHCSIVIETDETTEQCRGILLEGEAVLITEPRSLVEEMSAVIYKKYLGEIGLSDSETQSWLHDPENAIIKMQPVEIHTW